MERPFEEVWPVHHCHKESSIPSPSAAYWPLYTVGFTNQFFSNTVDNTVTHLVYIWDANGKQGFYYRKQNKTNGNIKIYICSDTQVGFLQILYYTTVPILFNLNFKECEPKLVYENHVKDMYCFKNYDCSYSEHMQSVI